MARVPSDPAQVIVNHASFRVQLGATSGRALRLDDTARIPVVPAGVAVPAKRRPAPVVWSGRSAPGDPLAGELMRAVRRADAGRAGGGTQLLPRVEETTVLPTVVGQRAAAEPSSGLLGGVRPGRGGYGPADDGPETRWATGSQGPRGAGGPQDAAGGAAGTDASEAGARRAREHRGDPAKHAWYPDRRLNLGIVLLPLRVFLGFISIYAGMGKLCDRVYFDGGKRGSMVTWLTSLHPWGLAEPLRDAALNHPVGAGLSIAFLQVVVGALTVCGLWQRVAGAFGAALSITLLVTVSWRTVPVYDAPDFIYLAAWSPLIIAGAPVYSIDSHLAGDAWRRLGPRVSVWDLRRRVLRRGALLAAVIAGSALLIGSVLGAAVRATTTPDGRPGPGVTPVNNLPGAPLPEVTGGSGATAGGPSPLPSQSGSATAKARAEKAKEQAQAHKKQATQAPSTAPTGQGGGDATSTGSAGSGADSTPTHSGPDAESGSSGGTGGPQTSEAPPAPTAEAPAPAPPTARPTPGAIGGLLGSHSPTGLLLGMEPRGTSRGNSPGGGSGAGA
ncbi:DoxX family membrane protein [Streptomyces sp. ITFR-21]|nr:DoxX family membrane protein [Streptomyces sp. ITFR-21]WNI19719.1 DoxX family membrane protein [Streptomyces sp. ITFR-21]